MYRVVAAVINQWLKSGTKPLLIMGARQVGKTYTVQNTLMPHCRKLHIFNFEKNRSLASLFQETLNPNELIKKLALFANHEIDLQNDVIFFDEIQACGEAITSLKYFNEDLPQAKVVATGSYIGLMQSFPVGKVETLEMFPMTFAEFLFAIVGDSPIVTAFRRRDISPALFGQIWPLLLEYFYVGGLPEVVALWAKKRQYSPVEGAQAVRVLQEQLIDSYHLDFGKYSGRNAPQIVGVFQNLPNQLAQFIDGSVQKFKFKNVLPKKKSYAELEGPIVWLEQMRMMHRSFIVKDPTVPLITHESHFKGYVFDMGILSAQLGISLNQHLNAKYDYKGYIAENFVANELKALPARKLYTWRSAGDAEIEFLFPSGGEFATPIEVKSGKRTRSKSLDNFRLRYKPTRSIKLVGTAGGIQGDLLTLPLYYAGFLPEFFL
ncbi:MAG: ATP-binding protein [Deltaproteobacteria bacterium]|nr:ATP-binding protein [Deltaproteobacteria bacterium]